MKYEYECKPEKSGEGCYCCHEDRVPRDCKFHPFYERLRSYVLGVYV